MAAFEAGHPGVGADNHPDAFRDESGRLIGTDEFSAISQLYRLTEAASRRGQAAGTPPTPFWCHLAPR